MFAELVWHKWCKTCVINVTPPLLIVPSIVAFFFRSSGSCDCFGVLNCSYSIVSPENPKPVFVVYSPDLVWD